MKIASIVCGFGEVESIPILIRRIAHQIDPVLPIKILRPIRISESELKKNVGRAVMLAILKLEGPGGILIFSDCDWKNACPAKDGPKILNIARRTRSDIPISVVLAKREYESWFLAAANSIAGERDLFDDLASPANPELIRDAKGWLSKHKKFGSYSETVDQPALTARFDIDQARSADSFDKCYREICAVISKLKLEINENSQ